jgi:hypothetical protein
MAKVKGIPFLGFPRIDAYIVPDLQVGDGRRFKSPVARAAFRFFRDYLNGAITQWNRLVEAENANRLLGGGGDGRAFDQARIDLHFYLICWDKMHKYLEVFVTEQDEPEISTIHSQVKSLLRNGKLARDHLEHLNERFTDKTAVFHSRGMGSDGSLTFDYDDVRNKGDKVRRSVRLGKSEVERMVVVYRDIVSRLEAHP